MTEVAPIPNDNTKLSGLTLILKLPWISLKDSDAPDIPTKSLFNKLCGDCVNASILPKESGKTIHFADVSWQSNVFRIAFAFQFDKVVGENQ